METIRVYQSFYLPKTDTGSRTPVWLKNPNTMEYFEKGEEEIDYDATASVYLQTTSSGEWEVCVVKIFDIVDEKVYRGKTTTISVSVTLLF